MKGQVILLIGIILGVSIGYYFYVHPFDNLLQGYVSRSDELTCESLKPLLAIQPGAYWGGDQASTYQMLQDSSQYPVEPGSASMIRRDYTWSYLGSSWTISLAIPQDLYEHYRSIWRPSTDNYSIFVTLQSNDGYLASVIKEFNKIAFQKGLPESMRMPLVISFVQSLPYRSDLETTGFDDYPRYPVETLVDKGVDCEDTAILMAALLKEMNYDVVLLRFPSHVAVGVNVGNAYGYHFGHNGRDYYYLETTDPGWSIGEMPDALKGNPCWVYDLETGPLIMQNWTTDWDGPNFILTVKVRNFGSDSGEGYRVTAGFEDGDGKVLSPVSSKSFHLDSGDEVTYTMKMHMPTIKQIRLAVKVVDLEGRYVDVSYSVWFNISSPSM